MTNYCSDDLKLSGSTDSLSPVDYGNNFAVDTGNVRNVTVQRNS